jgi:hypothetical protein
MATAQLSSWGNTFYMVSADAFESLTEHKFEPFLFVLVPLRGGPNLYLSGGCGWLLRWCHRTPRFSKWWFRDWSAPEGFDPPRKRWRNANEEMAERDRANPTPQQPNLQNTNTTNSQALAERSVQEKKAKREEEEKKRIFFQRASGIRWKGCEGG